MEDRTGRTSEERDRGHPGGRRRPVRGGGVQKGHTVKVGCMVKGEVAGLPQGPVDAAEHEAKRGEDASESSGLPVVGEGLSGGQGLRRTGLSLTGRWEGPGEADQNVAC